MRKKLLLAEDSVTMQKVFELAFAQSDIAVITVENGHDVARLAEEIRPDLIVADVTLPGRDGYAVASAIGEEETTREIPVLLLCGIQVPLDEDLVKASGAKGVLFKPFESRELLEKVDSFIRGKVESAGSEPPSEAPPRDEHWDFSDVLDEVGADLPIPGADDRGAAVPASAMMRGVEESKDEPASMTEFDVSIDDIEEPPPAEAVHIEGSIEEDAPAAITDLEPALEEAGEIEEIPDLPEVHEIHDVDEAEETRDVPDAEEPRAAEEPQARPLIHEAPGVTGTVEPPSEPVFAPFREPAPASRPEPGAADPADALQAALKEQFVERADAIFRAVASEAVEKVMWEMMDRLSAELSEKVRASVEAVAWEVIPATAEALIREEIARIRTQAGKSPR
jgi:CheY-like chemotaxis protein